MKYITYSGHHNQFNCMLAQVANAHPQIGLFKTDIGNTGSKPIYNCGISETNIMCAARK